MDYILNPWWIYLVKQSDTINRALGAIGLISGAIFFISWIVKTYIKHYNEVNDEEISEGRKEAGISTCKRVMNISLPLSIIGLIGALIIPSSDTIIYMLVAKVATYSNIDFTIDKLKEVVDYIISAIAKIK